MPVDNLPFLFTSFIDKVTIRDRELLKISGFIIVGATRSHFVSRCYMLETRGNKEQFFPLSGHASFSKCVHLSVYVRM